jgi:GT2 family glycosyltransferase
MKLSIVIICWNDRKVILDCVESIYRETTQTEFEVILSDNGSTDGSVAAVLEKFPAVRVVENGANLGFSRGNNAGIRVARGQYVLILNPDTIIHKDALDRLIRYADDHPEAGAFGCRVLNRDGSFQHPANPFPTVARYWLAALGLRSVSDRYYGWDGTSERAVDWQSGCCVLVRADLLRELGGFDERFFYNFEEVDLCLRVWKAGKQILYYPGAQITHLGGQSTGRFPIRFALEKFRNRYRYVYKHYGMNAVRRSRHAAIAGLAARLAVFSLRRLTNTSEVIANRLAMYKVLLRWHRQMRPVEFVMRGIEPDVGFEPLAPAPDMLASAADVRLDAARAGCNLA